jgi:hypothetical protein
MKDFSDWVRPLLDVHPWEWEFFCSYLLPDETGAVYGIVNLEEAIRRYGVKKDCLYAVRWRVNFYSALYLIRAEVGRWDAMLQV